MKKIAPVLKKGLDFLNANSLGTNCISARLLVEEEKDKSAGFAFFLSLTDMEQWAWNHSTHGAIYNCFMNDCIYLVLFYYFILFEIEF
jgi:aldoxime dehydratase